MTGYTGRVGEIWIRLYEHPEVPTTALGVSRGHNHWPSLLFSVT